MTNKSLLISLCIADTIKDFSKVKLDGDKEFDFANYKKNISILIRNYIQDNIEDTLNIENIKPILTSKSKYLNFDELDRIINFINSQLNNNFQDNNNSEDLEVNKNEIISGIKKIFNKE
jgi:hypothetical protein